MVKPDTPLLARLPAAEVIAGLATPAAAVN